MGLKTGLTVPCFATEAANKSLFGVPMHDIDMTSQCVGVAQTLSAMFTFENERFATIAILMRFQHWHRRKHFT